MFKTEFENLRRTCPLIHNITNYVTVNDCANMVLACKVPVNIMHADTRDIEGKAMGQMIIQLPEDDTDAGRICNYLKTANVKFEEVR